MRKGETETNAECNLAPIYTGDMREVFFHVADCCFGGVTWVGITRSVRNQPRIDNVKREGMARLH